MKKCSYTLCFALLITFSEISLSQNTDSIPFAPAFQYEMYSEAFSAYCADLDADGDQDLAVSDRSKNVVSIFKNRGDGCFESRADYVTGAAPRQIFLSDLDADGDSDIAVVNSNQNSGNSVSVLKNQGDGSFFAKVDYPTGEGPVSLFVADLDNDSDQDLAVANFWTYSVSILKNNGDGTFANKVDYDAGANTQSVFASDLDLDNDYDLVVANREDSNISIFENNGDGTFSARVNYPSGIFPHHLFVSDLDSDTFPDIVVPNYISGTISIFINNGDGTLADRVDYFVGSSPIAIFAADLDGDGDLDIAVGKQNSNTISIFKNNGDGTLASKVDYLTGQNPLLLYAADLDGDGDLDLAVPNLFGKTVSILKNLTISGPPCSYPIIAALVEKFVLEEDESLSFQVSTCGGCPGITVLSAENLPPQAFFYDSGNGTGVFTFTPDSTQGGEYYVTFIACDSLVCDSQTVQITVSCSDAKKGDLSGNGSVNLQDLVILVNYIFKSGPTPVKCVADVNSDDIINLADIIFLVNRLFRHGPAPSPPTCCLSCCL